MAWMALGMGVLGLRPVAITSGSMGPVISPGDVLLVDDHDGAELEAGQVVTFADPAPDLDRLITHRVVEVLPDGEYRTRGDNSAAVDPLPITVDHVEAVPKVLVPMIARPVLWLQRGELMPLGAWALLSLGALRVVSLAPTHQRRPPQPRFSAASRPPAGDPAAEKRGGWWVRPLGDRGRWAVRGAWALVVANLVVGVSAVAIHGPSVAAFTGERDNPANQLAATTLEAPFALSATPGCVLVVLVPKVDLSWTGDPDATTHRVLRSTTPGGPYAEVGSTSGSSFTDTAVLAGTTYHYVVRSAAGAQWTSASSVEVGATTPTLCL